MNFKHRCLFSATLLLVTVLIFSTCKKDVIIKDIHWYQKNQGNNTTPDIRNIAYQAIQDFYLWDEVLPSIEEFKPQTTSDLDNLMMKVRSYQPLDRFSFVEKKNQTDQSHQGLSSDFGFFVKFYRHCFDLRVSYVYPNSLAGRLGIKRGWKILKLNGRYLNGSNQPDVNYLNDVFLGTSRSANCEFEKPDGTTIAMRIFKGVFPLNTVLHRSIFTNGSKKTGYFVFNQFSEKTSVSELESTFNYFQANGVNELIIDLRYNPGGFISTQDALANMIAPQSVGRGQKIMYTCMYNKKHSELNKNTYFDKVNSLDLSRVVFIVGPQSASASELLINNLWPVMHVKLVGEKHTYGKCVGFFPIPVLDYNIYPVSFKAINSVGKGDFYQGFYVDKDSPDDLEHDFGDANEASLKEALNYINTGGFSFCQATGQRIMSLKPPAMDEIDGIDEITMREIVEKINAQLNSGIPKVAIENRPEKMPKFIRDLQRKN